MKVQKQMAHNNHTCRSRVRSMHIIVFYCSNRERIQHEIHNTTTRQNLHKELFYLFCIFNSKMVHQNKARDENKETDDPVKCPSRSPCVPTFEGNAHIDFSWSARRNPMRGTATCNCHPAL